MTGAYLKTTLSVHNYEHDYVWKALFMETLKSFQELTFSIK